MMVPFIRAPFLALLIAAPVSAQSTFVKAELRNEILGGLKEYVKVKTVETAVDNTFDNEKLNDLVDLYSACKVPINPACIYTVFFKPKLAGDPREEELIEAERLRQQACAEFLATIFPVWKEKSLTAAKDKKALTDLADKLQARKDALDAEREEVNKATASFREPVTHELAGLKTEYERIIQAERDLNDSMTEEQEAIKRDAEAFANSVVAKDHAEYQRFFSKYFRDLMQNADLPEAVRNGAKRHLDHFSATGDFLPDRPIPKMEPMLWEYYFKLVNKCNHDFKEGRKRLDDRESSLRWRTQSEGDKLKKESQAYTNRMKAVQERKNAIDERIERLNEAVAKLQMELGEFQKRRQTVADELAVQAGDKLIRECIAVYEKADGQRGVRWRAEFDHVLSQTRLIEVAGPFGQSRSQELITPALTPTNPLGPPSGVVGPLPRNPFGPPSRLEGPVPRNPLVAPDQR